MIDLQAMQIGNKIKKIRELKNFTQNYMADSLGISQSAYSKIELGELEVTMSRLEKIAEIFKMKTEDVLSFNDKMIFNISNNLNGGNVFGEINYHLSENERKMYEDQIKILKNEIEFLRKILEHTLESNKD